MQKITSVEHLRNDVEKLHNLTAGLGKDIFQINEFVHKDEFIPEDLEQKVTDNLCEINLLQNHIKEQFAELKLGEVPKQITALENFLEDYQKKLELKNKYLETVTFFMSLHSEEAEIEKLLDERKTQLALLKLDSMEERELDEKLKPYILLKQTLEEKDLRKKFALLYQLTDFFEEEIFSGIGRGKISSLQEKNRETGDEKNTLQEAAEETAPLEELRSVEKISEKKQIPEEAFQESVQKIETKEDSEEKQDQGEAETVKKPEVSVEPEEPETRDSVDTKADNFETENIEESDIWEQLGIKEPASVCYEEQTARLNVETMPKASDKFGVSKFKNDIAKQSCREKLDCLVEIINGCVYSKESIALYQGREAGYYNLITDKLYQLGYLKKYSVDGMGEFYTLSARGEKAFATKDSLAFIQNHKRSISRIDLSDRTEIEDTANAAISRILLCDCYARTIQIDPEYEFMKRSMLLANDSFLLSFTDVLGKFRIEYLSIVSEKAEEFLDLQEMMEKLHADVMPDYIIVMEPDRELALHVAEWVRTEVDPEIRIGYCVHSEKEVFDLSSEQLLEISSPDGTETEEQDGDKSDDTTETDFESIENEEDSILTPQISGEDETEAVSMEVTELPETEQSIPESVEDEKTEESSSEPGQVKENADTENPAEKENSETKDETVEGVGETIDADLQQDKTAEYLQDEKSNIPKVITHEEEKQHISASFYSGVFTETDKKKYNEEYQKMLASGKFYAATALLKSLSKEIPYYEPVYRQVAYALNDPMADCSYSSETVIGVFYEGETPVSDYFVIAAALRDYFYDQFNYEYSLPQLQSMISGSEVLRDVHAVEEIVYMLQKFKSEYQTGMDRYADYREKEQALLEERLEKTRREAKGYYDNYSAGNLKENASHKRFIETSKLLLGPKSDLSEFLEMVIEDNREMLEMLEEFLAVNYVKDQAAICEENIDSGKINRILDDYWNRAAQNMRLVKKTSDLMSSLRMNLFKKVQKIVSVLCTYVFLCKSNISTQDDPAFREYKRNRKALLENIEESVNELAINASDMLEIQADKRVLMETLLEIRSRVEGDYKEGSYKYFYMNFLKNNKILLDENFLPVLDEVLELPEFSVRKRILSHCKESDAEEKSWEERIEDIYKQEDNYGSAELIFQYVEKQEIPFENLDEQRSKKEEAMGYPKSDMENKRREFIEDLELAQSYGQTDNSRVNMKEIIIQIMETWFVWAEQTANYGFFSQILDAFLEKIHEDAKTREAELNNDLAVYLEKNKEYESNEMISGVVEQIKERIRQQNYAAAEDLLNRLIRNDLDPEDSMQHEQTDYLMQFLEEYDINYRKTANSGTTLKSLISTFRSNKDTRGANKLLENWPKGAGVGENTLRIFLNALGFDPDTVKAEPRLQGKIEGYLITLKRPQNGRKSNYKHPISAFGSEAETKGFRVVCLFGKTDASRLIDTFKEIGNAKNTLVLLDYALSLADRRILARKTKTDLSGKIFAVLDRVAVLYLAKHYAETAVNRMLMYIIMPFASYQPYINKSADVMPQEIFIGRRYELEKIESPTGVNLVYGGRQLGKTALLRMAKKDIDQNENGDRAIIVDAREKDYRATAKAVSAALYDEGIIKKENITEDWDVLARDIKNRLRDEEEPIPYFLLMIDEADVFIESCEAINYKPFDALKDIQSMGSGRFKFVVAGLRNIVRFKQATVLKNNIGLVHLESLTVKPFKSMEARELLEVPLSYLGFRFPKDNETEVLISTIFGTTNYFPGLIQLYCTKMIEAIRRDYAGYSESDTPPYYVKKEHIKKVLAEQSLQDDIYDKFSITLKVDDDDYYYIIALLVAYHYHENRSSNGCNAQELMQLADAFSVKKITTLDEEKLTALMEEMRELNVLQYTGDGCYRFTRHSFCQMMGTPDHIDDELEKYMED